MHYGCGRLMRCACAQFSRALRGRSCYVHDGGAMRFQLERMLSARKARTHTTASGTRWSTSRAGKSCATRRSKPEMAKSSSGGWEATYVHFCIGKVWAPIFEPPESGTSFIQFGEDGRISTKIASVFELKFGLGEAIARDALHFPPQQPNRLHDHWRVLTRGKGPESNRSCERMPLFARE